MRIFRALAESIEPLSKYVIEKRALVYDSEIVLRRLVKLGIVKTVESEVVKYELNRENSFTREFEPFLKSIGYLKN